MPDIVQRFLEKRIPDVARPELIPALPPDHSIVQNPAEHWFTWTSAFEVPPDPAYTQHTTTLAAQECHTPGSS
jgi:hypothetical protein